MNNPLIIHYYDLKKLKGDCELNDDFLKLYKRFCPGPITFILNQKKKSKISKNHYLDYNHLLIFLNHNNE